MKRIIAVLSAALLLAACADKKEEGKFTLNGELKNTPDQKIYLDQFFFSPKDPEVLDTAEIKNGKFSVSAIAHEEGFYILRFEKQATTYPFINDQSVISLKADPSSESISDPVYNTRANNILKNFMVGIDERQKKMISLSLAIDSLQHSSTSDSLLDTKITAANNEALAFKSFILKSIDTLSDPVAAMFAVSYTRKMSPEEIKDPVNNLGKRFPEHKALASLVTQFNEMLTEYNAAKQAPATASANGPAIGSIAPEFSLPDSSGKIISLSSFRGKYLLIDFWASWCAPCRGENPNVVANFKKFKDKNFTILGVSLDDEKKPWLTAIKKDGLAWTQVSDLKGWNTDAVAKYGFESIPYNVLIDPQGKIIATSLREEALGKKLSEIFR